MLRRAIQSCLDQTVPCEIVVVDDGSEDGTPGVVQEIPGVKYIRHELSLGQSAAENRGIREASCEWIKPLDDDDRLLPDCLEKMTAAIEKAQAKGFHPVIVSGRAANVDEAGRELSRTRSRAPVPSIIQSRDQLQLMMFDHSPIGTPVQVGYQREAALRQGGWNERRPFTHAHGGEIETWIKLAAQGDCLFLPWIIAQRTIWPGNTERGISAEERYLSSIYLKELIAVELGRKVPGRVKGFLALHWALIAARNGTYDQAVRLGLRSLLQPLSVFCLFRKGAMNKARQFAVPLETAPAIGEEDSKVLGHLFPAAADVGAPPSA